MHFRCACWTFLARGLGEFAKVTGKKSWTANWQLESMSPEAARLQRNINTTICKIAKQALHCKSQTAREKSPWDCRRRCNIIEPGSYPVHAERAMKWVELFHCVLSGESFGSRVGLELRRFWGLDRAAGHIAASIAHSVAHAACQVFAAHDCHSHHAMLMKTCAHAQKMRMPLAQLYEYVPAR